MITLNNLRYLGEKELVKFWRSPSYLHFERLAINKPCSKLRSSQPFRNRVNSYSGPNPCWGFRDNYVDSFLRDLCECQQSTFICLFAKADQTSRSDRLFQQQRFMGTERSYNDPCLVPYSRAHISLFSPYSLYCSHGESFLDFHLQNMGQPKRQSDNTKLKTWLNSFPVVWYCTCEAFGVVSFSQRHLALAKGNKKTVWFSNLVCWTKYAVWHQSNHKSSFNYDK